MSDDTPRAGALEISGPPTGLLDDPLTLRVRGGGPDLAVAWRARMQDDDGRVWRARAARAEALPAAWRPDKTPKGPFAALQSLRPLSIEVRVESSDRRAAKRMIARGLVADGVRLRRWRDGLAATLCLPAGPPVATVVLVATGGPQALAVATLAGPLLASRSVLALVLAPAGARRSGEDVLALAMQRLAAVPGAGEALVLAPEELVIPPGVPAVDAPDEATGRAAAWDALLARLGATPRA